MTQFIGIDVGRRLTKVVTFDNANLSSTVGVWRERNSEADLGSYLKQHYPGFLLASDPLYGNASGFRKMEMVRWLTKK